MNSINYQKELDKVIANIEDIGHRPRLLLHSCCAPCSSYCLVYLRKWFDITCFYYNPNITDAAEYKHRIEELHRLVDELNEDPIVISHCNNTIALEMFDKELLNQLGRIDYIDGDYEPMLFLESVRNGNLANEPEGGKRCGMCFEQRLKEAARVANEGGYDYFTTSLTISPLKNAEVLNTIGMAMASEYVGGTMWLPSDFKKRNGYKFSVELCKRYDMYRQDYCGCVYSMRDTKQDERR